MSLQRLLRRAEAETLRYEWTDAFGHGEGDLESLHRALLDRHGKCFDSLLVQDVTGGKDAAELLTLRRTSLEPAQVGEFATYTLHRANGQHLADLYV